MTQVERDAICQSILAMNETEQRVVLECIPIQFMLDHIGQRVCQQDMFIENVKQAIHTAMV